MPGRWADLAAQSIIHALVAALVVEALVRVWRVARPDEKLALRLVALAQPLVVTPALVLLCPGRTDDQFHDQWALFSGRHWESLNLGGWSPFEAFLVAMGALGLLLFLMDLLPLLRAEQGGPAAAAEPPPSLFAEVAELAGAAGMAAPRIRFLDASAPVIHCAGVRRPALVASRGALALLDEPERRAALAHELAHLARRDPLVSWLLMAARAALFFNPVVQVLARAMAREGERRADDAAGALAGNRPALAGALLKLHRASGPGRPRRSLPFAAALSEPLRRARSRDVEVRCRRLLDPDPPRVGGLAALRLVLAALCVPALLYFVT